MDTEMNCTSPSVRSVAARLTAANKALCLQSTSSLCRQYLHMLSCVVTCTLIMAAWLT